MACLGLAACAPSLPTATVATPEALREAIRSSDAPVTLVHAWATWCGPCREEFPELMEIDHTFSKKGLKLILVSADVPEDLEAVETFLAEQGSQTDSFIASELSQTFIEALSPTWAGTLPASFFYVDGKLVESWDGQRSFEHYAETINRYLTHKE